MTRNEIDLMTAATGAVRADEYAALCRSAMATQELHRVLNWFNTMSARVPNDQITENDRLLVARITDMLNHREGLQDGTRKHGQSDAGATGTGRQRLFETHQLANELIEIVRRD